MRLLDRYILKEFVGPFLFGMGAFAVMVIGGMVAPMLLKLMIREHFPLGLVIHLFMLRLPQVLVFTFPMAMIFGSVMTTANMSGNGEVIAVRAGGASLWRLAAPILITGLLLSMTNVVFNEVLVPASLDAAWDLQTDYLRKSKPVEDLLFKIPSHNPQRIIYAKEFDPRRKTLKNLFITEFRHGEAWQTLKAAEAEWGGRDWLLRDVEIKTVDARGYWHSVRTNIHFHDIGKDPEELADRPVLLDEMSIAQLQAELAKRRAAHAPYKPDLIQVIQYINTRRAIPWVPLFFAFVGIPLGMRPTRASTGIGLGLSLVVALAYFVLSSSLHLVGQQGAVPCVVAAWLPHSVLLGTGLALFAHAGR